MGVQLSERKITHYRQMVDYDLQFLEEILDLLDTQLDRLDADIEDHPDPHGWGLYDRFEYVAELGFIACQNYLSEIRAENGRAARFLKLGPRHSSGQFVAEIVHAGANYAKHHAEGLTNTDNIAVLEALGVWEGGDHYFQIGSLFSTRHSSRNRHASRPSYR